MNCVICGRTTRNNRRTCSVACQATRRHRALTAGRLRAGKGQGLAEGQQEIADALEQLRPGWACEYPVVPHAAGYPAYYSLDVAHPFAMVDVELDGPSHTLKDRKLQDARRDQFLSDRGWTIIRLPHTSTTPVLLPT